MLTLLLVFTSFRQRPLDWHRPRRGRSAVPRYAVYVIDLKVGVSPENVVGVKCLEGGAL